jgi:hypothetical protein
MWPVHAPLLFPYCGRLFDHVLRAKGKERPAAVRGFAQHMAFECEETRSDRAVFSCTYFAMKWFVKKVLGTIARKTNL